jgi:hypothetical protein
VRPERQKEIEVGFDAQMFAGRVSWEVSAYQKSISDLLLQRALAPSTGFSTEIFNGGSLRVRGLETVINATPYRGQSMSWQMGFNWAANRSLVTHLPVPAYIAKGSVTQGAIKIEEGKSVTQVIGNDTLPGAFNALNPQAFVRVIGNGEPKWTAGWTNTVQYKRLSLGTTIDAVKGGLINLGTWRHFDQSLNGYDQEDINPATGVARGVERRKWGSLVALTYTRDASFIKLREVRLSADLPRAFVTRAWGKINSARVSLSGRNLLTNQSILGGNFFKGSDPEVANYNSGTQDANNVEWTREFAAYPSSRTFWFTLDLSF